MSARIYQAHRTPLCAIVFGRNSRHSVRLQFTRTQRDSIPGGISTPVPRATGGETVIARFAIASGPGAGADAPECLATFKPDRPGPYHAAFLLTVLTNELTEFARTRLLSGLSQTIRSIVLVKGTPHSVNVDGVPVLGWALLADGASGIVCEHRDRILMWLGTEHAVIPRSISTKIMTSTGWQEDN
jgi:hypothetical protein